MATKLSVNERLSYAARLGITALATAAWLAVSNHCVIAAGTAPNPATGANAHSCCSDESNPARPAGDQKPSTVECCKTLSTPSASFDRTQIGYQPGHFIPFHFSKSRLCEAPPARPVDGFVRDTGPPGAISFAESVLQRSVLAHAPPRRA
jgi:hypothetical protein